MTILSMDDINYRCRLTTAKDFFSITNNWILFSSWIYLCSRSIFTTYVFEVEVNSITLIYDLEVSFAQLSVSLIY